MASILRVKDKDGNVIDIPAIKGEKGKDGVNGKDGENYILTDADKAEIVSKVLDELPESGGSTTRPTSEKVITQDDGNFMFISESVGTGRIFYLIMIEEDLTLPADTEIADLEISCDSIYNGKYISIYDMFGVDGRPYTIMNRKIYHNEALGFIITAIYFPLGLNQVTTNLENFEWASARITYYTN